jgi:hemerythrin
MTDDNPRHILGIPEMDEQHRYLYALFDSMERYFPSGKPSPGSKNLLDEKERYLLFHFASEEHFMRMYEFPGFAMHQSDHEQAGNKAAAFLDDFSTDRLNPAAFRIFLTGWLMEHSASADAEYAEWIKKKRGEIGLL